MYEEKLNDIFYDFSPHKKFEYTLYEKPYVEWQCTQIEP